MSAAGSCRRANGMPPRCLAADSEKARSGFPREVPVPATWRYNDQTADLD